MVNVKLSVTRRIPAVFIYNDIAEQHTVSVFSVEEYSAVDILTNIQGVTPRIPRYLRAVSLFQTLIHIIFVIQFTNSLPTMESVS